MSEVAQDNNKGKKKGKTKKMSTRVDFTPMVDLGFLLITFFMLATTLSKPQTMEIALPSKEKVEEKDQSNIKASRAVTILLGKDNKIFYYEGTREHDIDPELIEVNYSPTGIRQFLLKKNYEVMVKVRDLKIEKESKKLSDKEFEKRKDEIIGDKKAPIVCIKGTDLSSYKNLVDILDEMAICNIGRYAIMDITPFDLELLAKKSL
ncbi:MAG: biopolymer transporter ExbD [Bacteroidia bacterium]|jgi:biopolymer transport protein ExbD|nr:biopolymer transporter ExbD [Bacteroidia bacterium]